MNKIAFAISALLGFIGSAALAADLPVKVPYVAPPSLFSWSGWYVGGSGGYGLGNSGAVQPSATGIDFGTFGNEGTRQLGTVLPVINAPPFDTNPRGPLGGLQFGYNDQIGRIVWGFEADYSWANINGSPRTHTGSGRVDFLNTFDLNITTVSFNERLDGLGTIRGRVGFTPSERSLIYATGGFAYGPASSNTAISAVQFLNGNVGLPGDTFTPSSGTGSKTLAGWTVGGGGEWAFAPHWSVKAEYLYYDLGTLSYSIPDVTLIAVTGSLPFAKVMTTTSARFNGSIARVGINYHFGGP